MESVCRMVGFDDDEQTATLIKGKPLEYSGELYSKEHNCKFTVERVTAQITPNPTDKRNYNSISTKYRLGSGAGRSSKNYEKPFANPYRDNKNTKGRNFETLFQKIANGIMNYSVFLITFVFG